MSTRLQVVLDEAELEEIRAAARSRRMTVAEWVRQSLRRAREDEPRRPPEEKLRAIDAAKRYAFPSGEIAEMLDDIERGRGLDTRR